MNWLLTTLKLILIGIILAGTPVLAEADNSPKVSKAAAIKVAQSEVKGKVLSATLIASKGPPVYRVKMLVGEGRVRTVFVDGNTGKVIRIN